MYEDVEEARWKRILGHNSLTSQRNYYIIIVEVEVPHWWGQLGAKELPREAIEMKKAVAVLIVLFLVAASAVPVLAAQGKAVPKGKLRTDILVHYGKTDNPGKGPGKGGGGGGDKVNDYYELLGPKWSSLPLGYAIDISFSPVDPVAGAGEIEAAFEAWDSATTAELFAEPAVSDQVTVAFNDLNNTVSWRILSGYPQAIAVTVLRYYDNDGNGEMSADDEFAAFDVIFNLMQKWAIDPDGEGRLKADAKGKWFDVRNIATHEMGHVVGLADLYADDYSELTMFGYASTKETKKISLEVSDIKGAEALYSP